MPIRADRPGALPTSFGVRFCRKYRCNEAGYERRIFWRCLNRRTLPYALVIMVFAPTVFHAERVLIKDLWRVRNLEGAEEALRYYQGLQGRRTSAWRPRISSRRVVRVAKKVFAS